MIDRQRHRPGAANRCSKRGRRILKSGHDEASNGDVLIFTGNGSGTDNNTGDTIQAIDVGSEVQLTNNASITGGTFTTSNGGVIRENNGQNAFISDLTDAAPSSPTIIRFFTLLGRSPIPAALSGFRRGRKDIFLDADPIFNGNGTVRLSVPTRASAPAAARLA